MEITKEEQRIIETFEMWCKRRILKIKWTDMIINKGALERTSEKRPLWSSIKKRRNEWIGLRYGGFLGLIIE